MHIFIDESGNFIEGSDWGLVCALALPHKALGPVRRELKFRTRDWPTDGGELKGRLLDPVHVIALVDILYRHSALLHCCAMCLAFENADDLVLHQKKQAEGITIHLTDEHHPNVVEQIWQLRHTLERMPQQLYLQCVVQSQLVSSIAEMSVNYFSQRRPRELGLFEWSIDAKDGSKITTQEKWWRDTLGPLLESQSRREPFKFVRDRNFDVSHFERSYFFEKDQWYPDKPRQLVRGVDIRKIIMDCVYFKDSKSDVLLQAIDVLANYMRRALSDKINDREVIRALGRLQIPKKPNPNGTRQSVQIISLSRPHAGKYLPTTGLKQKLDLMAASGRRMILK